MLHSLDQKQINCLIEFYLFTYLFFRVLFLVFVGICGRLFFSVFCSCCLFVCSNFKQENVNAKMVYEIFTFFS